MCIPIPCDLLPHMREKVKGLSGDFGPDLALKESWDRNYHKIELKGTGRRLGGVKVERKWR